MILGGCRCVLMDRVGFVCMACSSKMWPAHHQQLSVANCRESVSHRAEVPKLGASIVRCASIKYRYVSLDNI